jgi:poly(A) polymerase
MREIWMMQPRLERRAGNAVLTMVEQPRFRAGLDFLRLRGEAGEVDPELARWWESFAQADADERHRLLNALRGRDGPRRAPRPDAEGRDAPAATEGRGATGGLSSAKRPARRTPRRPASAAGDGASRPGLRVMRPSRPIKRSARRSSSQERLLAAVDDSPPLPGPRQPPGSAPMKQR